MNKKIYITSPLPEIGINMLKQRYETEVAPVHHPDPNHLIQKSKDCHALVTVLSDKIDERLFSVSPHLKVVANYAVGYNNIDIQAARKHHVFVTHTPDVLTRATAEIAFAMMITLTRRIIEADRFTREGRFTGWDPLLFLGDELTGKYLGIIGMGRIGQDMAFKSEAFGMNILYYNRKPVAPEIEKELNATYLSFETLLKESDVISVHTPLTPETHHLISDAAFQKMKTGVYILNTSRGEVIDEAALVRALQQGKVRGAGLDVYEAEPEITKALLTMKNVVLLPHIGSATAEARNKMSEMVARNVIAGLEGKIPENLIPELASL